ncbi:MAG TPA: response regulator transcription factor [Candidatus Micrarchaeaceae archaeon]|nr:response regulator transcription factor [Candidatus Micrarchaeaceae archaeon]
MTGTRRAEDDPVTSRNPIRIVIVEDQLLVADVLEALLSRQVGMEVVANLSSMGDSAVRVAELSPDVVILDFREDDEAAAAAVKAICQPGSGTKMIFLTDVEQPNVTLAAIDAGACAVLYLSMASADLIQAVRFVADGGSLISPQTIATLLMSRRKSDGMRDSLTSREREILSLIAEGKTNRAIAVAVGISYVTVRSHVRNVAVKLAAHSRLEVLVRAQQLDLVGGRSTSRTAFRAGVTNVGSCPN